MKKIVFVPLLLFVMLCAAGAVAESGETAPTFADESIGAELSIPEDWTTTGEDGQYLFTSSDGLVCVSLHAMGMRMEEMTPQTVRELMDEVEATLSVMPDYQRVFAQISEETEDPGLMLLASYTSGEESITQWVMIGLGNGEDMLQISCTFPSEMTDETLDLLEEILLPLSEDQVLDGALE